MPKCHSKRCWPGEIKLNPLRPKARNGTVHRTLDRGSRNLRARRRGDRLFEVERQNRLPWNTGGLLQIS